MHLYVELRGKVWYIRGTVKIFGGKSIPVTKSARTTDKRKAEALASQLERQLQEEHALGKKAVTTFLEAAVAFVAAGGSDRFLGTESEGVCGKFAHRKLSSITQADLDIAAVALYPRAQPETRLRQFYTPFRAVWNFAATEGWADVRKWRMPKKPKGTNIERLAPLRAGSQPTSYDRACEFVAAMSPAPAMVMTALFFTGMRPIELFALTARDVSVPKRWITIRNSKTGEPRGVPMHECLVRLFESLLKRDDLKTEPRIFRTYKGHPYEAREDMGGQLKKAVKGARERSGITDISPYTARHTVSTQLVVNGVHPYMKDQILGHAADDMSRHYTNIPQKPLIEAINTIEAPKDWLEFEWWEDPLAWTTRLFGEPGRRTDLEERRA